MKSKIAELIKLTNEPIAIIQSDEPLEGALKFKEGVWGCAAAMVVAASKGKAAMFYPENTVCLGAKTGLGFQDYPHGWIEYFLSTGNEKIPNGEYYKKNPQLATDFIEGIERFEGKKYLLMVPLSQVQPETKPLCVTFLVNPDQLSALATLANYDQPTQNNVQLLFGAGCAQAVLYPMTEELKGGIRCFVGMTDPSARKCLDKNLLSFGMPYSRYLMLEEEAEGSFLTKETWTGILKRV